MSKPLGFEASDPEVEQEAPGQFRSLEIVDGLSLFLRSEATDGFQLDNDLAEADEIGPTCALEVSPLVLD